MSFRIVRITRTPVDGRTFESATEAQDAACALAETDGMPGVEYAIAHVSFPLAEDLPPVRRLPESARDALGWS